MNKFSNYFLMFCAVLAFGFLSSCGNDDETPTPGDPVINLSTEDGENETDFSGYVGDSVILDVSVTAPAGFNTLRVFRQENGVRGTAIRTYSKASGTTPTSFDTTFVYKIRSEDLDNAVFLVFEAVDEVGSSTLQYQINASEKPTMEYSTKLLYAPNSSRESKTFFSTNTGETYSVNDISNTTESVSGLIDFGYYYGGTDNASLASPAAYPSTIYPLTGWDVKNATKLRLSTVTATQFFENKNNVEFINQAFESGTAGSNEGIVTKLVDGQILAFELGDAKSNKRGLIKITDLVGTTGSEAYIEMDIIVVD